MTTALADAPQVTTDRQPGYIAHTVEVDGCAWQVYEETNDDITEWAGVFFPCTGPDAWSGYAPRPTTFAYGTITEVITAAYAHLESRKAWAGINARDWSRDVAAIEALRLAAVSA